MNVTDRSNNTFNVDKPYISIIVTVYNVGRYLRECVESIRNQLYQNWELILVDDGSVDDGAAICDEYARIDDRIRVIHKINGGLPEARKTGMRAARYDYITFVDGDDWVEPEMYEEMCRHIYEDGAQIVQCNLRAVYPSRIEEKGHTFREGLYDKEYFAHTILPHMIYLGDFYKFGLSPSLCNKVFLKSLLEPHLEAVSAKMNNGEDVVTSYPTIMDADGYYICHGFYYNYRSVEGSMCRSFDENRIVDNHRCFESIWNSMHAYETCKEQLYHYMVYQTILVLNSLMGKVCFYNFLK